MVSLPVLTVMWERSAGYWRTAWITDGVPRIKMRCLVMICHADPMTGAGQKPHYTHKMILRRKKVFYEPKITYF